MSDFILHHYEMSPFSEKARRMFAFKGLAYRAVRAPAVMPKPDVLALTGGYRKIPVLQRGNHVYCDTALIARVLERERPSPTFYPTPLAQSVAEWIDSALFETTVPVALRPTRFDDLLKWLTQEEMHKFAEDRKAMGQTARRLPPPAKISRVNLQIYFARLDATLATTPYLLGERASIADFSAYHCAWFVRSLSPELIATYTHLHAWMERIAALPDPQVTPIGSGEAIEICKASPEAWSADYPFQDPMGLAQGQRVFVAALDYGTDPVEGELVASNLDEVVLRRRDERAGTVYVHFPRIGFDIKTPKT